MRGRRLAVVLAIAACLANSCSAPRDHRASAAIQLLEIPISSATAKGRAQALLCTSAPPARPLPAPGQMPVGSRMAEIRARGHLVVGVDQNTMLFGYLNPINESMEGFEVDVARQIAYAIFGDRRPDRVQFTPVLTNQRTDVVKAGQVDLVVDAITTTCARSRDVDFSTIYFMAHQRTMVRTTSHANSLRDLKGRKVCATNGSTALTLLEDSKSGVKPYPVAARTDCLVALQTGLVAGIQTDDAILYGFHAQDPLTRILHEPYTDEPYGIAVSKSHPDLVTFVNAVLARMRGGDAAATPLRSWRSLYREWLTPVTGVTQPTPPIPVRCQEATSCPS